MKDLKLKILFLGIIFTFSIICLTQVAFGYSINRIFQHNNNTIFRMVRTVTSQNDIKIKIKTEFNLNSIKEADLLTSYLKKEEIHCNTLDEVNNWLDNEFNILPNRQYKKEILRKILKKAYNLTGNRKDKVNYLGLLIENFQYI